MEATPSQPHIAGRPLIAPLRHTVIFLLIVFAGIAYGFHLQSQSAPSVGGGTSARQVGAALIYASAMLGDWALLYFVWVGARRNGVTLSEMVGGRWKNWKDLALDLAIATPFWVLWTATATLVWRIVGPTHSPRGPLLLPPEGAFNIALWIAVSCTAGFCEEVIFRGYFQQQVRAITGSAAVAVCAQAVLFGAAHSYQGVKPMIVISVLGLLYGLLALWRKNLRPGMISHAWSDIYGGYVIFLLRP